MKIKAEKYILTLSYSELWDLALTVKEQLYDNIETHWVHHQLEWRECEAKRIDMLRSMFYMLNRPDMYDEIEKKAIHVFGKFNEKE